MSIYSKVVWSEGMFLNPQHFQQQDRYYEQYIEGRFRAFGAYGWGWHEFTVDQQLLKLGKISLLSARGVLPDGTPFNVPEGDEAPPVLELPETLHNKVVYLALPVRRPGALDVLPPEGGPGLARYQAGEIDVRDGSSDTGTSSLIRVGKLRLRLLLETDDLSGYAALGMLRISEVRDDRQVILDDQYVPPVLDCAAATRLHGFLNELTGMLHHRGEAIAGRLADARRAGTAEIADYMMLQLVNRLEPLAAHMAGHRGLHPQVLYSELLQMVGELSTFTAKTRRPPQFPAYRHDDLQATFAPVMQALRQSLSMVQEQTAIALSLVEKKFGIRVAQIPDPTLVDTSSFVLAVRADVPGETLRARFPAQAKMGSVERIRQLVNAQLPGIPMRPLAVAPRQIPYHAGFTYFELERNSDFWKELRQSGGFALHVGADYPGLELELWAIRD